MAAALDHLWLTSLLESRRRIENNEITTKIDWFIHYFEKNLA